MYSLGQQLDNLNPNHRLSIAVISIRPLKSNTETNNLNGRWQRTDFCPRVSVDISIYLFEYSEY